MSDVASILADVRSLANRGAHHAIVARYGGLDDTPEEETWNSTELLFEIGRAHELSGDHAAAEAAYHEAAALPRGAFAFLALGRFQARVSGDLPGAASALVEALRRVPAAEPLVRVELARIELAVG